MKTLINSIILTAIVCFGAMAAMAQDEKHGFEWYGGYSFLSEDTGLGDFDPTFDNRFNSHGVETSITGNFHRYVGLKGDLSYHSKTEGFVDGPDNLDVKFRTTQVLGGLQFKDNRKDGGRLRPFAHILAGVAHQSVSARGFITPDPINESVSSNNFAMAIGGGLDVNVSHDVSIRLIQVDYNPIFMRGQTIGGTTFDGRMQSNIRVGVGIVVH
jgi:opacity protein-like surface antigen